MTHKHSSRVDDRPSFQFYPKDWLSEPGLRSCGLAEKGLWMDMLCLMWQAENRGCLRFACQADASRALARMCGCSTAEAKQSLSRLKAAGVYSTLEDGTIYSRRMVREEKQRSSKVQAGRLGGIASRTQAKC
jgi:hypothetical protein